MAHRRKAFTLTELLVGVSITSIIGLAVASVAVAVSNYNQQSTAYYEYMQTSRAAGAKLQSILRESLLVAGGGDDSLVLWTHDAFDPGYINVSEATLVYYDAPARAVKNRSIVFPSTLPAAQREAMDHRVPLNALVSLSHASAVPFPQYEKRSMLAGNVRDFTVTCSPARPRAELVKFRLDIGEGDISVEAVGGASLRAADVTRVAESGGVFVLTDPATSRTLDVLRDGSILPLDILNNGQ